jgi:cysteine-rich repeat protein
MKLVNIAIQEVFRALIISLIFGFFCFLPSCSQAQVGQTDAIAVRIIPNLERSSALRWYKNQGFSGSPQEIIIDGYSGVRDGRTVYINAANIAIDDQGNADPSDDIQVLHTNIYLISFNQEASFYTKDIFSSILKNWKFNSNIPGNGFCEANPNRRCSVDTDCESKDFCMGEKAQIVRDVRRLESLYEIKTALDSYYDEKQHYPKLSAGTYLPNKTLSVWPSWQKVLAQDLRINLPIDPVNRLGDCGGDNFNPITCWDEETQRFADSDLFDEAINLPNDSSAFIYTVNPEGDNYDICATMESGYVQGTGSGACGGASVNLVSSTDGNNQPLIVFANVESGNFGYEYSGFFLVYDEDGDNVTVALDTGPDSQWDSWSDAPVLEEMPVANQYKLSADYAGAEGTYGIEITLNDNQGESNSEAVYTYLIRVVNTPPRFLVSDRYYPASSTAQVSFGLQVLEGESNYPVTYSFIGDDPTADLAGLSSTWDGNTGQYSLFGQLSIAPQNVFNSRTDATSFSYTFEATDAGGRVARTNFSIHVGNYAPRFITRRAYEVFYTVGFDINPYRLIVRDEEGNAVDFSSTALPPGLTGTEIQEKVFEISGLPNGPHPLNRAYPVSIYATDEYGYQNSYEFVIVVTNIRPIIEPFNCLDVARIGDAYSCDTISARDQDGHAIVLYEMENLPPGLSYNSTTAEINGVVNAAGQYNISVRAIDEYGARSEKAFFPITVNSFCGDGVRQNLNSEGRGGPLNNGIEECDGLDGIALTISESSPDRMYSCSTPPQCTIGADCTGTCTYVSGVAGGWCGDGITQGPAVINDGVGENCDDGLGNSDSVPYPCYDDCLTFCGDGNIDQGEICDDNNFINNDACDRYCQWTCQEFSDIRLSLVGGPSDAMWYDDNPDPNSTNYVVGGEYLKLSTSMPTPYIWIANSHYDGCTSGGSNPNCNVISKIRTFNGYRRDENGWDTSTWETRGQLIGVYPTGSDPSRTAVNIETGDVWVANRGSGNITKLGINGNVKKTCSAGGTHSRGVAIEENGDVWIANYDQGTVVKLPGNDTDCGIEATVTVGANPYGLAIDGDNNVWVSNRGGDLIQRINTSNLSVTNFTPPDAAITCGSAGYSPYGITVDLDNNVWAADTCHGVWKLDTSSGSFVHQSFLGLNNSTGRSRGVTIDTSGSIWIAFDNSNQVVKIPDPNVPSSYSVHNLPGGAAFPIGIVGDSTGNVWVVNQNSDNTSVFGPAGNVVGTYRIRPGGVNINPYTYSDMTGLNRAMIIRSGSWISDNSGVFDSGHNNQHWGRISWQEIIPSSSQSIDVNIRADNVNPENQSWMSSDFWNSLPLSGRVGRILQIQIVMRSREKGITPVLWDLSLSCD